jgi:hypothetical protein
VICSIAFCKKKTNPFNYYYIVYYLNLFLKKIIELKIKSPAFRLAMGSKRYAKSRVCAPSSVFRPEISVALKVRAPVKLGKFTTPKSLKLHNIQFFFCQTISDGSYIAKSVSRKAELYLSLFMILTIKIM